MKKATKIFFTSLIIVLLLGIVACSEASNGNEKNFPTSTWDGKAVDTSWYSAVESELRIENAEQFAGFAKLVNDGTDFYGLTVVLCSNIDLGGFEWTPIGIGTGTYKGTFAGVFDGNSCTISNFKITSSNLEQIGLFGVNEGTILNLNVTEFEINLVSEMELINVGGIVGRNSGQIDMCYSSGNIDAYARYYCRVGMLVGMNDEGNIYNSYTEGNVISHSFSSVYSGGITGNNFKGGVYSCYSLCTVSSSSDDSSMCYAGGLIGSNSGTVYDSLAVGNVSSKTDADGYFNTTVIKNISYAGGIVGKNSGDGSTHNCYRFNNQTVFGDIIETSGSVVTENDLKSVKLYNDMLNWSDSVWIINSDKYPQLK